MFRKLSKILVLVLLVWLLLRVFFFQVYRVPSGSMQPLLNPGDHIVVNKLAYGARLPMTPLALPFSDRLFLTWISFPYLRLPGYNEVRRGDVLIFNYPADLTLPVDCRQPFVKRCTALPGDTVLIKAGNFISPIQSAETTILRRYTIGKNIRFLTAEQRDSVLKLGLVPVEMPVDSTIYSLLIFPHNSQFNWNQDNFGPLRVPAKGMSIPLNDSTLIFYSDCFRHEGHQVVKNADRFLVDGQPALSYIFSMDYYFVTGDNRYNSSDSRFWGFVPESHLIGRLAGSY